VRRIITAVDGQLSHHHRDTVRKIFSHPTTANLEWREVSRCWRPSGLSMRSTTEGSRYNGRFAVTLGSEVEIIDTPPLRTSRGR